MSAQDSIMETPLSFSDNEEQSPTAVNQQATCHSQHDQTTTDTSSPDHSLKFSDLVPEVSPFTEGWQQFYTFQDQEINDHKSSASEVPLIDLAGLQQESDCKDIE